MHVYACISTLPVDIRYGKRLATAPLGAHGLRGSENPPHPLPSHSFHDRVPNTLYRYGIVIDRHLNNYTGTEADLSDAEKHV